MSSVEIYTMSPKYITTTPGYTTPMTGYGDARMPSGRAVGEVWFDISTMELKVYDGYQWQVVTGGSASVSLTGQTERILDWAEKKMLEDESLKARMEKHPGLKEAYEQFKIMDALTVEPDEIGQNG